MLTVCSEGMHVVLLLICPKARDASTKTTTAMRSSLTVAIFGGATDLMWIRHCNIAALSEETRVGQSERYREQSPAAKCV